MATTKVSKYNQPGLKPIPCVKFKNTLHLWWLGQSKNSNKVKNHFL